ncbi:MAG TPA: M20/M25/M40 family metallo-hydrolase, partial [Bacillota bacterium]|nr:M20/M25/M40 family metallo-hydrolase [Bacillota bacterium]
MLNCKEEILDLTKHLVSMNSIVNTHGEPVIAHALYSLLSSHPYFSDNPDRLTIEQTLNDFRERYNVLAFVKGTKKPSNRTVVLMGHMDTVGVDDFNKFHDKAFQPDEWMEVLENEFIPDSVREQLNSGDWLFGRGVLDMKSGLSSNMYLLQHYATHPDELEGNIVFVAECDEEDGSHGILSAIKTLKEWKKAHAFEYVAAINADFVAPRYEGDPNRYIYKGAAGKLLPTFYITGTETHVGSCFEGLDPNYIAAELTRQINYNPDLCNESQGEVTTPPISLKQTDLKPSYSVQTALAALTYYNFFIHSWSPREVLDKLKSEAEVAFKRAIESCDEHYKQFCDKTGATYEPVQYRVRVLDYEEMEKYLMDEYGVEYTLHMENVKQ